MALYRLDDLPADIRRAVGGAVVACFAVAAIILLVRWLVL